MVRPGQVLSPEAEGRSPDPPAYRRDEDVAHTLDRNWAELVQELRVIGTGIQILFAFLLSIPFQARFAQATAFQRDVYLVTLLASGLAATLFITPVALHRFLFRFGAKDVIVNFTTRLAIGGLVALSLALTGAVLLVGDWLETAVFGWTAAGLTLVVLGASWFAVPLALRHRLGPDQPD